MAKNIFTLLAFILLFVSGVRAQSTPIIVPGSSVIPASTVNGTLDDLQDFALVTQVPFRMPDGAKLQTDIYLPILQDSLSFSFTIPVINQVANLTVFPKGIQYIIYDTINGVKNPNPFQLPMIFERTPYNKDGAVEGQAMALLGYAAGVADMRGRYTSDGVYLPLYSDSWAKWPYHDYTHVLDITDPSDPRNGNNHEDGYNSIEFIKNQLKRTYDIDGDGIVDDTALVYNGSIGTFGASALGYNQLQAAAAHRIDPTQPGLRCIFPIVATLEFYKSTGFHNGTFRDCLVTGWLRGQIKDTRDDLMDIDFSIDDSIHSSKDYNTEDKFEASNRAIDHFSVIKYEGSPAGFYPNSIGRSDMDGSRAPVDMNGESDRNGTYSRYTNMEVPCYHVTGWWDIFIDGQIETNNLQRTFLDETRDLQKIIIGPWAHQTISGRKTGDKVYPKNVTDLTRIDITDISANLDELALDQIAQSELIGWFRYNLNYHGYNKVGEPKVFIPKSNKWQTIIPNISVKFPAQDYKIKFTDLLNFMLATEGLKQVPLTIRIGALQIPLKLDIPKLDEPLISGFDANERLDSIPVADFKNEVPTFRMYVVGASNDDATVSYAGNYWLGSDTFPIPNVQWHNMYLHNNGSANFTKPTGDEGYGIYVHDPDDPIITVGGGNMIESTPQGDRDSQGQMNLADPNFAPFTMDREGVLKYETDVLPDSLSIVGFPKVKLFAKSNPGNAATGPTDCEFYVRILDVYPDGKEFFVVEGAVGARGREYARSIALGTEDVNAPFSNIDVGKLYEYYFQMFPIAYTFAKDHRIKVLISSSNYPRFQSCANVPIMPGEFFRRKPADGRTYLYNGIEYAPRKSVQRIAFSDVYDTRIELPVFGSTSVITSVRNPQNSRPDWDAQLFPNPSNGKFNVFISKNGKYLANVYNTIGEKILSREFLDQDHFDLSTLAKGQYMLELISEKDPQQKVTKPFSIF